MSLNNKFKLTSIALASAVAMGTMAMPTTASAELEYNAAVSSMYLWRGTDVSDGPAISGGADYSHDSGVYVGTWASSGVAGSNTNAPVGTTPGYEIDLYAGYAGEAAGLGYDISYWKIDYPQSVGANAGYELALGLSYADFSLGYVDCVTDSNCKYSYTTLGYTYDKYSITYGISDDAGTAADYTHLDLSIAVTDELSFTLSKADAEVPGGVAEELLVAVSYSLPIGK